MGVENQKQKPQGPQLKPSIHFKCLQEKPLCFLNLNKKNWFGYHRFKNDDAYVEWHQHFGFLISADGKNITCFTDQNSPQLSVYLYTQVYSFALIHQGVDSLHGSLLSKEGKTVALIGDCGRGKSTLASQLISHGWQLLGDDLIVFDSNQNRSNGLWVFPGEPFLKIQPRVFNKFFPDYKQNCVLNQFTRKKILAFPEVNQQPVFLHRIFYLNKPQAQISLRALSKIESYWVLNENIFNVVDFSPQRKRNLFAWLTQINNQARVLELNYPRKFEFLDAVENLITSELNL